MTDRHMKEFSTTLVLGKFISNHKKILTHPGITKFKKSDKFKC